MQLRDALRELVHRARTSQVRLVHDAGYASQSVVSSPISRNDIKVSTLVRLANAAGYDVMLVRRNAVEPELPIRIDAKRENGEEGGGGQCG